MCDFGRQCAIRPTLIVAIPYFFQSNRQANYAKYKTINISQRQQMIAAVVLFTRDWDNLKLKYFKQMILLLFFTAVYFVVFFFFFEKRNRSNCLIQCKLNITELEFV